MDIFKSSFKGNSEANTRRIENVEACFGSSGRKLLETGRVLIGEGILIKICRFWIFVLKLFLKIIF